MRAVVLLVLIVSQPIPPLLSGEPLPTPSRGLHLHGPERSDQPSANGIAPIALHATTPAAIADIRSRLVAQIWPGQGYPTRLADAIVNNVSVVTLESTIPLVNLRQIDRYVVTTSGNTVQPLVLRPAVSNGKLVLVGMGHATTGTLASSTTTPQLINIALERGATVLLTPMPSGGTSAHDALGTHRTASFHPLQYFLDPGIVALNTYLAQNPPPTEILGAGISGGGWSTVLIAALDPRVKKSFPIAGSLPLNLRDTSNPNDYGDWEQRLHGLTVDGTTALDYPDLYLMATSDGRSQVQINNELDSCCFYGTRHTAYASQLTSVTSDWTFHQESAAGLHGATQETMVEVLGTALGKTVGLEARTRTVGQLIDDGDTGFAATGSGWFHRRDEAAAFGGDIHHTSPECQVGGTGQHVATWTFVAIPDAEVDVAMTWTPHENRASNTPVSILDAGDRVLMSVAFNQKKAPVGFSVAGKVFQRVGRVSGSSGIVKVRMTDDANGCVVADAVFVKAATDLADAPRQDP